MRDYGKVHSTFWSSPTTVGLGTEAKLLALYLMTCAHGTMIGAFRLPDGYVAEDLGWSQEQVLTAMAELERAGFSVRCETTKWVWIKKHLVWNKPDNPNQKKAAVKMVQALPKSCAWLPEFITSYPQFGASERLPNSSEVVVGGLSQSVAVAVAVTVTEDSEAKASGGKPPVGKSEDSKREQPNCEDEAKSELWEAGKSLLRSQGLPTAQCGSFVGKLAKDYGQAVTLEAVRAAVVAQPANAAEYLKATCQRLKGERNDPVTVPCSDTRAEQHLSAMAERAAVATRPPAEVLALARKAVAS